MRRANGQRPTMIRSEEFCTYLFRRDAVGCTDERLNVRVSLMCDVQRRPRLTQDGPDSNDVWKFVEDMRPLHRAAAKAASAEGLAVARVSFSEAGEVTGLKVPPFPMDKPTFVEWLEVKGKCVYFRWGVTLPFTFAGCCQRGWPRVHRTGACHGESAGRGQRHCWTEQAKA